MQSINILAVVREMRAQSIDESDEFYKLLQNGLHNNTNFVENH